jgi:hypothetical protein
LPKQFAVDESFFIKGLNTVEIGLFTSADEGKTTTVEAAPAAAPAAAAPAAAPAAAQSVGVSIPEPSDGALFALGVAGLIVGRQVARKRK